MTEIVDDKGTTNAVGPSTMPTATDGWWEKARLTFLVGVVAKTEIRMHLDVGGGRGTFATELARNGTSVVCADGHRWEEWTQRSDVHFVVADADHLPFRTKAFSSVSALDVIEHLPEEDATVAELARVTSTNGAITITVPASQRLWSDHDRNVGHYRRYSLHTLRSVVDRAGLQPSQSTYFFAWLYPIAWLTRRSRGHLTGDEGGRITSWIARGLCTMERLVLRFCSLPFGTSLLMRATRRSADEPGG